MWGACLEIAATVGATVAMIFLVVLPGAAIAEFTGWLGVKDLGRSYQWGGALLLSVAILPATLSLIARLLNLEAALAAQLILALLGVLAARKMAPPPLSVVIGLLAGAVVIGAALADFSWGGKLYHAAFALDMVKHTATVNSIVSWGLPLSDPFVARGQPAGYYYYFYTVAATPVLLTRGILDARAAVGALGVLDGAALLSLAILLWQKCALGPPLTKNVVALLAALLLCGNLDILASLPYAIIWHRWPIEIEWWNEQVLPWSFAPLWVPHHLLALIAGVFGLLLISERPGATSAIVGGIAFASCVGASVWIGMVTAAAALLWLLSLIIRRQYVLAKTLGAAGCLAGLLLVPLVVDVMHGRADAGSPIALTIRWFAVADWLVSPGFTRDVLSIILLPLNYLIEFGILAVGAAIFCRQRGFATKSEAARILLCAAAAGLLFASFTRSTIINNDLGWRAAMLPQLTFLIWTAAVILARGEKFRVRECLQWPGAMALLLLIGYLGNAYAFLSARAYAALAPNVIFAPPIAVNPEIDAELASAYRWANAHIPRDAVLQHNPVAVERVLDFGLYGRNRVAVADSDAHFYGASKVEVAARLVAIGPIFTTDLTAAEVHSRALAQGIDVLVVSAADPIWIDRDSWIWSTPALFASSRVRLIAIHDLVPGG